MRFGKTARMITGAVLGLIAAVSASATDWSAEVKVTVIELSYMPGRLTFTVDGNVGSCAAGTWLTWFAQGSTEAAKAANSQAVLAGLMTARAANRPIRIYGANDGCTVEFIHLL